MQHESCCSNHHHLCFYLQQRKPFKEISMQFSLSTSDQILQTLRGIIKRIKADSYRILFNSLFSHNNYFMQFQSVSRVCFRLKTQRQCLITSLFPLDAAQFYSVCLFYHSCIEKDDILQKSLKINILGICYCWYKTNHNFY